MILARVSLSASLGVGLIGGGVVIAGGRSSSVTFLGSRGPITSRRLLITAGGRVSAADPEVVVIGGV